MAASASDIAEVTTSVDTAGVSPLTMPTTSVNGLVTASKPVMPTLSKMDRVEVKAPAGSTLAVPAMESSSPRMAAQSTVACGVGVAVARPNMPVAKRERIVKRMLV
jgi:hypothetical protein